MSAELPSMPTEPCRECGGVGMFRAGRDIGVECWRCNAVGEAEALPPVFCPWCWSLASMQTGLTITFPASGMRIYSCKPLGGERAKSATYDRHYQKMTSEPCPATPEDVAAVIRDIAAEKGKNLLRTLVGYPRQIPKVAKKTDVPQQCPGCTAPVKKKRKEGRYPGVYECGARYQNRSGKFRKRPSDCPRYGIDKTIHALLAGVRAPHISLRMRGFA